MTFEPSITIGTAVAAIGTAYAGFATFAVLSGIRRRSHKLRSKRIAADPAPVTILKPLCGAEPGLYENLRSFCAQDHPEFQIICGVRDLRDPAAGIVGRLQAEYPALDLQLVVDARIHGVNLKVSNLINMLPRARHQYLVLADSDVAVPPDYLREVTQPLGDPGVGVVTCLYRGVPRAGFWSRLGAMFIDDWFAPSVEVADALGSSRFSFGSTIALRRAALEDVGGLEAIADVLADDFWLGEFTRRRGLRTVLSPMVVTTDVIESSLPQLWSHEMRWLRTIRSVAPTGFGFTWITFTFPVVMAGFALARTETCLLIAAAGAAARVALHYLQRSGQGERPAASETWLIPVRDGLSLVQWAAAHLSTRVRWRDQFLDSRVGRFTKAFRSA